MCGMNTLPGGAWLGSWWLLYTQSMFLSGNAIHILDFGEKQSP